MKHLQFIVAILVFVAASAFSPTAQAAPKGPSIVDVAIEVNNDTGLFDTLIAALLAADPSVVETLSGNGQYTVFAPTDDAFAALGLTPETVSTLDQDALTAILLYHVAHGRRDAGSVIGAKQIRTLQGGFLQQNSGVLTDNLERNATIVLTDVKAANGIIHVIDAVVLPFAP